MWFGYSMIIFMAGIKSIPEDLYEAAHVDGASRWNVFWKITLPLLKPIMLYQVITSLIGGLSMFDIPYVLSGGEGAPQYSLPPVSVLADQRQLIGQRIFSTRLGSAHWHHPAPGSAEAERVKVRNH
jgi:ABC-type sugar transport system permease subunit